MSPCHVYRESSAPISIVLFFMITESEKYTNPMDSTYRPKAEKACVHSHPLPCSYLWHSRQYLYLNYSTTLQLFTKGYSIWNPHRGADWIALIGMPNPWFMYFSHFILRIATEFRNRYFNSLHIGGLAIHTLAFDSPWLLPVDVPLLIALDLTSSALRPCFLTCSFPLELVCPCLG